MMDAPAKQFVIRAIVREWTALPDEHRPPAVWVRQYASVECGDEHAIDIGSIPVAVWLLSAAGLRAQNVWPWQRFVTVQCLQPWCARMYKEPAAISGNSHEVGLAAFAPCSNTPGVYVEVIWGSTWARGAVLDFDQAGCVVDERTVWLS